MTFDDWYAEAIDDMKKFKEFWENMHQNDPESYPIELESGDWYEQFHIFDDGKK